MGGGGKSKQEPFVPVQRTQFNTDPSAYRGLGYQQVPNPYTADGKPAWMQGHFANPSWGMSAANPSQALTQADFGPQPPPPQAQAPQQQGFGMSPDLMAAMLFGGAPGGTPMGDAQARALMSQAGPGGAGKAPRR